MAFPSFLSFSSSYENFKHILRFLWHSSSPLLSSLVGLMEIMRGWFSEGQRNDAGGGIWTDPLQDRRCELRHWYSLLLGGYSRYRKMGSKSAGVFEKQRALLPWPRWRLLERGEQKSRWEAGSVSGTWRQFPFGLYSVCHSFYREMGSEFKIVTS